MQLKNTPLYSNEIIINTEIIYKTILVVWPAVIAYG